MKCDTTPKFLLSTTIYHFPTLGIVWSLFVVGPPTDEFLKNALFIDMKKQQKINLSAIGKFYTVSALLQNAHTCLYGNIVGHFFELSPPTLEHYFS
jgi:hypothetical protein